MSNDSLSPLYVFVLAIMLAVPSMAMARDVQAGQVTEYYTMINKQVSRATCRTEGNQIVKGQLWGSNCRKVKKYCQYGVGARDMCLRPCQDAAGARRLLGSTVHIKPRRCQWGPLKGQMISEVRIADVGSAVHGSHVDVFMGFCLKTVGGVCRQFEPDDTMVAEYDGHGPQLVQMASEEPGDGMGGATTGR